MVAGGAQGDPVIFSMDKSPSGLGRWCFFLSRFRSANPSDLGREPSDQSHEHHDLMFAHVTTCGVGVM